jgi:hypothetical protein
VSSRDYLLGDIDGYTNDGASSVDAAYIDPSWRTAIQNSSALPITGFDDLAGNKNVAFTIQHQLDAGERVVHGYLALGLKQSGDQVSSDFIRLFDMNAAHRLDFTTLGWDSKINSTSTYVGVIDLTPFTKVEVEGAGSADWLNRVCASEIDRPVGRIVYAKSSDPSERLGEDLLLRGKITVRQYLEASKLIRPGRRLGAILLELGALEAEDLMPSLEHHVKEMLLDVFTWTSGEYELLMNEPGLEDVITLNFSMENLIL